MYQENITMLNIYVPNTRALNFIIKRTLLQLNSDIDFNTVLVDDLIPKYCQWKGHQTKN